MLAEQTLDNRPKSELAAPTDTMAQVYTQYYKTGYYSQRYPSVSPYLLKRVIDALEGRNCILDFGCGNGRYLLPLLEHTNARIVGFDICETAIEQARERLANHPGRDRVTLICGDFDSCPEIDAAISMFGVISHIPGRAERVGTLAKIRQRMATRTTPRLVVSVPNLQRRFRKEQQAQRMKVVPGVFAGKPLEPNDITYCRETPDHQVLWLYYHLYNEGTLREDLKEAGYAVRSVTPESVLTEFTITHSTNYARFDDILRRVVPTAAGYGLLAVAD